MKMLIVFCLMLSVSAQAQTLVSTIHSIEVDPSGRDHFIKLDSGEVVFIDDMQTVTDIKISAQDAKKIEFHLDQNDQVVSWNAVAEDFNLTTNISEVANYTVSPDFKPSVVRGEATVASMFATMRTDTKRRAECFHRAYIWAHEEYKRSGRLLTKHFLFFTRKYIRENRYKWWFHVAPSALFVNEMGKEEFLVLDRSYGKKALTVKEWTDLFISTKRSCPVVYKYSHYNNHQEVEDCYLIPSPTYYLQPLDIENFEKTGVEKKSFQPGDLNVSYRRGFRGSPL